MLDCRRWTLTHSSGWADVLVELGLAPAFALALVLELGFAARRAASEAEAVAEAEVWDDDGEADGEPDDLEGDAEGDLDGELDPAGDLDGELDPEAEPDGAAEAGALLGSLLGLVVAAGEVEELEVDGVGVGAFDGFGVAFGVGVGLGEDVLEAGSTWQLVSVFALALVEVPRFDAAAASLSVPACAVPGRPASTPRVRKPPPTTLSAARTYARRMRIALSPLLIRLLSALYGFGGD